VAAVDFASGEHQLSEVGLNAVITLVVAAVILIVVGVVVLAFVEKKA